MICFENNLPVVSSVFSPKALGDEISCVYALGAVTECTLLRSYVNDAYELRTETGRYIIKVYRANWRSESDLRYELDFLLHLDAHGVNVSLPLHKCDGELVHIVKAPEGLRYAVLYYFAEGVKPTKPFSDTLYYHLGQVLGKLHKVSTDFHTDHSRFQLDSDYLINTPLSVLQPFLVDRKDDWTFLLSLSEKTRQKMETLNGKLNTCVCHGDFTLDNLNISEDGKITLYDFDAGGRGFCAYDLLGVYLFSKYDKRQSRWQSHLQGYKEITQFNESDIESLPYMHVMNVIWGLGCDAATWTQTSGLWRISGEYLNNIMFELRNWVEMEIE